MKGGLIFISYKFDRTRPTKDIDFLGVSVSSDMEEIAQIVDSICAIQVDDGVIFDRNSIATEIINQGEKHEYIGIRTKIDSTLSGIKMKLSIDVGFGDKLETEPLEIEYPVILDLPAPLIKVYSCETVIAEKFETIVKLGIINSRMKDFFDIHFLSQNYSFEMNELKKNILTTFNQRHTDISNRSYIFSDDFKNNENKSIQWEAFLRKNKIKTKEIFSSIIEKIEIFIEPIFQNENKKKWNIKKSSWE